LAKERRPKAFLFLFLHFLFIFLHFLVFFIIIQVGYFPPIFVHHFFLEDFSFMRSCFLGYRSLKTKRLDIKFKRIRKNVCCLIILNAGQLLLISMFLWATLLSGLQRKLNNWRITFGIFADAIPRNFFWTILSFLKTKYQMKRNIILR
jgi:hypothetical protein